MDELLKLVGDAGLHASTAEEAIEAGEHQAARDALDLGDDVLAALRTRWPKMSAAERGIIGKTAAAVKARLDAVRVQVPRTVSLSEGAPEADPEEEAPPPGDEAEPIRPPL